MAYDPSQGIILYYNALTLAESFFSKAPLILCARDVMMTKILVKRELKPASKVAIFGSRFTVN
jgi:hypothetical protein